MKDEKNPNNFNAVNSVTIFGGGTAGWITALSLTVQCPQLAITLIQPKSHSVIGVGESTQPDLMELINKAGIPMGEFIRECDATAKCGIYYEDWYDIGTHFWHPFSDMGHGETNYTLAHHYQQLMLKEPEKYTHEDYYDAVHPSYDACVVHRKVDGKNAAALHVDADKMHKFLRDRLDNVTVYEPETIEVVSEDNEEIRFIDCDGVKVGGDLFIDCTGFNRVLMQHLNNVDEDAKEYYHENVESAIFARIPYVDREKEMLPYTKAHAQKHGWIWTIPLFSRIGSGYVYTKNSCTADEAEKQFREYWGVERMKDVPLKHIEFKSDSLKQPWKNNVVAIGLSSGFVEPLEATGINWIVTAANNLSAALARKYYDQHVIDFYNSGMSNYVSDVQDFIDVHYKLSNRRDSVLWNYHTVRGHNPRLYKKLEVYSTEMPAKWNRPRHMPWAFNEVSWIDILNGYKFKFEMQDINDETLSKMQKEFARIRSLKKGRAEHCLTPYDFIKDIHDTNNNTPMEELPNK
jgi:tryptophan halogenase